MSASQPGGPLSPAFDVDRVEWVPGERGALEVRVFGAFRGPGPVGLSFLLIDDGRQRHMFPALSTPPISRPGMWSAAFHVPGELRSWLGRPMAMRVGIGEVALPAARAGAIEEREPAEVVDQAVLAERRARRAELVEEELVHRAGEAERAAKAMEAQLGALEERLREVVAERDAALASAHDRDRAVVVAGQRAHAERALREEAEEERHQIERFLRAELDDARARLADVEGRAEEAERLRRRLIEAHSARSDLAARAGTAEQEREALAERLAAAQSERTDLVARLDAAEAERASLAERLAAAQSERTALVARLDATQGQRDALSERLAVLEAEREATTGHTAAAQRPGEDLASPAPLTAVPEPASPSPAEGELTGDLAGTLRSELADERARREQDLLALRTELATAIDGLRAELARLAARGLPAVDADPPETAALEAQTPEPAGEEAPLLPAVHVVKGAQLTALAEELERARPRPVEGPQGRLVADLSAAARRLRENGHGAGEGAQRHGAEADAADVATASDGGSATDEATVRATASPSDVPPRAQPEVPAGVVAFPTRVVPEGDRYEDEWLAEAVEAIADDDTALAARILEALLPAQRHVVKRPLRYDLGIEGAGTYRVELADGEARIEQRAALFADDVDFSVSGPVRSVGRLVTGSTRWRLRGARVEGSRRRLWRLKRARRAPLSLAALVRAGDDLEPGLVFTLLARAVDRRWTDDQPLEVVYHLTGEREATWHVATTGGAPLTVTDAPPPQGGDGPPRAIVEVPAEAFLSLLTREPLPEGTAATVTGDPATVALLHAWFDRVQGLPIAD